MYYYENNVDYRLTTKFQELKSILISDKLENVVEIDILLKNGVTKTITKNSKILLNQTVLKVFKNRENKINLYTIIFIEDIVSISFKSFKSCEYCSKAYIDCDEVLENGICENFKLNHV